MGSRTLAVHCEHGVRRLLVSGLLWLVLVLCAASARAQDPRPQVLDPARPTVAVGSALGWLGPAHRGGIDAVAGGRLPLRPFTLRDAVHFQPGQKLWLKLRLQAAAGAPQGWQLEVPVPVVDQVTLYQQDASGRWFARSAGDLVPMREWSQRGRYPFFRLQLREDAPVEVFLEVRHATALSLPVRLVTEEAHYQRTQVEYLVLGLAMGALALLVCASFVRCVLLRDAAHAWYAMYALVATLALSAFTGVAGHLLWGDAGQWVDAAPGCLALLAGALAMRMVAGLSAIIARSRRLGRGLHLAALLGPVLALVFLLVDRNAGLLVLGGYIVAVAGLGISAAAVTWRRGDPVGRWMLCGAVPLALAVVVALARVAGWLPASWLSEYALVLALTIELPMLFGALNSRSHERRSVELRRLASASQDPLTGLLRRAAFVARLQQALARHQRRGEAAAVAMIDVVNYEWIKKSRGTEAAEEALLRTVIKLRRLVRDVDTTGRVGEHRFGLILEGVALRQPMAVVASRLVAAGLMEEPDAPRDSVLHFHIAAVLLNEYSAPAEELLQRLGGMLDGMAPRARRPLRFFEPDVPPLAQQPQPKGATGPAAEPAVAWQRS